jgi:uncharacterized OB-fold protein
MTERTPSKAVETSPFRLDDPTWIGLPASVDERAIAAAPVESAPYWDGLVEGIVRFQRCTSCRRYTHSPIGGCQWCGGPVVYEQVDPRGTVSTWTLAFLEFGPGMEPPYVTAIVSPDVEPELQLMTNLVNVRVSDIRIGMAVVPKIMHGEDRALLFFEPDPADTSRDAGGDRVLPDPSGDRG